MAPAHRPRRPSLGSVHPRQPRRHRRARLLRRGIRGDVGHGGQLRVLAGLQPSRGAAALAGLGRLSNGVAGVERRGARGPHWTLRRPAAVRPAHRARGQPREHPHPHGCGNRLGLPVAGGVGVHPLDEGHAWYRPPVVPRSSGVAEPRYRPRGHGGDRGGVLRSRSGPVVRLAPNAGRPDRRSGVRPPHLRTLGTPTPGGGRARDLGRAARLPLDCARRGVLGVAGGVAGGNGDGGGPTARSR